MIRVSFFQNSEVKMHFVPPYCLILTTSWSSASRSQWPNSLLFVLTCHNCHFINFKHSQLDKHLRKILELKQVIFHEEQSWFCCESKDIGEILILIKIIFISNNEGLHIEMRDIKVTSKIRNMNKVKISWKLYSDFRIFSWIYSKSISVQIPSLHFSVFTNDLQQKRMSREECCYWTVISENFNLAWRPHRHRQGPPLRMCINIRG